MDPGTENILKSKKSSFIIKSNVHHRLESLQNEFILPYFKQQAERMTAKRKRMVMGDPNHKVLY